MRLYLPVALSSYMNHDDYVIFFEEDMYCGILKCGRPVSAEILYGVLMKVVPFFQSLTFFSILRLVNAAAIATGRGPFAPSAAISTIVPSSGRARRITFPSGSIRISAGRA